MDFKVNDRVRVYGMCKREGGGSVNFIEGDIGTIKILSQGEHRKGYFWVNTEHGLVEAHPKQCRKLKQRRRVWIHKDNLRAPNPPAVCWSGSIHQVEQNYPDYVQFIEVTKKG